MSDVTSKLLKRYESKRAERPSVGVQDRDPQLWSYRQAAAVLHCFHPETLRPLDPKLRHPRPRLLLFDDIVSAAGGRASRLFTLNPEVRRQALRQFPSREAMRAALQANPDRPQTPLQRMWEAYLLKGSVPPPETLGYRQLTYLCQILSWLDGADKNLPAQDKVADLTRRRSVLAGFEHLVSSDFTGRVNELDMLRGHIGALPSATGVRAFVSHVADWLMASRKPILALHGPGGIGKSALIGRLLLEQAQAEPHARIPFAYLAFDQPTLRIDKPFTLLVETAAQFEQQFPEHAERIDLFHQSVRDYRDGRGALGERRKVSVSRSARIGEVRELDRSLYLDFAHLLKAISKRRHDGVMVQSPVLLALDTFEEVQYRDRESLSGFWDMLAIIHEAYRPFRVLISGRALAAGTERMAHVVEVRELAELPLEDRVTLLGRLGVSDDAMARVVAEQVGGNPLSLRLAANVLASDPDAITPKGIKDLSTRKWLFFQVDQQIIQGRLYRRILDHIHDENVRKLAHPGMVLRRVSPEVIMEVLAPLCRIPIKGMDEAERLFEELRSEHALVQAGEEGTLVYRPEIRQAMIRLLEQDKFGEVRELHRAAVAFYSGKSETSARAEEMYHRLVLDEDPPWVLDDRWTEGIEQSVAASLDEYPDRAKAWLASRMSLEVPRSVFAAADVAEWERNITRKVQQALSHLEVEWALELLAERTERSEASPLFALEAKAHLLGKNLVGAWDVLERGIERVSDSTNRGRLAELFWLQAQVALLRNDPQTADRLLARAEHSIENGDSPIPLMHVLCQRLLLRAKLPADYPESAAELRPRLNGACERLDESAAFSAPFVVGLAVSALGKEFPKTAERLGSFISFNGRPSGDLSSFSSDQLTSENLQGLEEYREQWELGSEPTADEAA